MSILVCKNCGAVIDGLHACKTSLLGISYTVPPQPSTGDSSEITEDITPVDDGAVYESCGFAEWRHRDPKHPCKRLPTPTATDTELKGYIFDLTDKHFPKDKCKERGHAMVLVAEALMAIGKHDHRIALQAQRDTLQLVLGWYEDGKRPAKPVVLLRRRIAEIDTQLTGEGMKT